MAEHRVTVTQPARDVVNNDYISEIYSDEAKLGQLELSKGGVDWWTRHAKVSTTLSWEDLALILDACRADLPAMRDAARTLIASD